MRMIKKIGFLFGLVLALSFNVPLDAQVSQPIKVWDLRFGGDNRDTDVNTIRTSDGGFFMTGSSKSGVSGNKTTANQGNDDWWTIKLDADGSIAWEFNFGAIAEEGFEAGAVETSDGHYVLAGRTRSGISGDITTASRGANDIMVVKIDGNGGGVLWQTRLGGNGEDVAYDVVETSSGNIVVGGYTTSSTLPGLPPMGSLDAYMAQLDVNGAVIWERTYGSSGFESLDQLLPGQNGGVLAGGYTTSTDLGDTNNGSFDYWVFEIDESGNQIWEQLYGGPGLDAVRSMAYSADGGILIGGQSDSGIGGDKSQAAQGLDDMWLVKTDATGNLIWEKSYGGSGYDWAQSIYGLSDGTFVFGGFSNSGISGNKTSESLSGSLDVWFLKADADGNVLWQGLFGGDASDGDVNIPYYDEITNEIYLGGSTNSGLGHYLSTENFGIKSDFFLTKYRLSGLKSNEVFACLDASAQVTVLNSIVGKSYQLRNTDGTDNGPAVIGTGSDLDLTSSAISQGTALDVYAISELSDGSFLEEFVGQAQVGIDTSLLEASETELEYKSDVCYNRRAKVWILESVAGITYQLVDAAGEIYGERVGNGSKIHVKTHKLKADVELSLNMISATCSSLHSTDISIQVSDKIEVEIVFDEDELFTDQEIDFSTTNDEQIVKWIWKFDNKSPKTGKDVSHEFKRPGTHWVKLKVENASGCKKQIVKRIHIKEEIFLGAPGLFEPNSGNGPFKVRLKNVTHEKLSIFNRYGLPIYHGKNSWDGTRGRRLVREGLYIYYIRARKKDGTLFIKRGSFYLKH